MKDVKHAHKHTHTHTHTLRVRTQIHIRPKWQDKQPQMRKTTRQKNQFVEVKLWTAAKSVSISQSQWRMSVTAARHGFCLMTSSTCFTCKRAALRLLTVREKWHSSEQCRQVTHRETNQFNYKHTGALWESFCQSQWRVFLFVTALLCSQCAYKILQV